MSQGLNKTFVPVYFHTIGFLKQKQQIQKQEWETDHWNQVLIV